jgi:hypothetical protein
LRPDERGLDHLSGAVHKPATPTRSDRRRVSRATSRVGGLVWLAAGAAGALAVSAALAGDPDWLKPGAERSPFSWAGAAATLLAAAGAVLLARTGSAGRRLLLAALLTVIAADQALGLHEQFAADLDARRVALSWDTVAFGGEALLLVAAGLLLVLEARRRSHVSVAAGVALLGVALVMRFGGGVLAALHHLPAGETRRSGEAAAHGLALSGWVLVAAGLLARARGTGAAGRYAGSSTQSRVR